jgi:hypothetical protein
VFHLQYVVGGPLNVLGYLVPMRRSEQQSTEDQHIQGALEQINSAGRFFLHFDGR